MNSKVPALEEAPPEERAGRSFGAGAALDADTLPLPVARASLPDVSPGVDATRPLLLPLFRFLVVVNSCSLTVSGGSSFIQCVVHPVAWAFSRS